MATPTAPQIAAPRSRSARSGNFELNSWLFMRGSGALLLVLVFGHLFVNLMLGEGIKQIDFAFVAGKWANPFWQVWDLAMLWLAMLHGGNGLRTIINDYAVKANSRFALKTLLYFGTAVVIVLGTLVIFTFDPCIDPKSTLDACRMK
jgi:succinate dehydrogenase / fumarate reductase membrane anchor subunit